MKMYRNTHPGHWDAQAAEAAYQNFKHQKGSNYLAILQKYNQITQLEVGETTPQMRKKRFNELYEEMHDTVSAI